MSIRRQSGGRASFVSWLWAGASEDHPKEGQMLEPWASMPSTPRDRWPAKRMRLWEGLQRFWRLRWIPPESRFQPREASCPWLYATDFPPLLPRRGTFYSWEMPGGLRSALKQSRRCPRGLIMMKSSFCQWNKPACLINHVWRNYSMLLSAAADHGDLRGRKCYVNTPFLINKTDGNCVWTHYAWMHPRPIYDHRRV